MDQILLGSVQKRFLGNLAQPPIHHPFNRLVDIAEQNRQKFWKKQALFF